MMNPHYFSEAEWNGDRAHAGRRILTVVQNESLPRGRLEGTKFPDDDMAELYNNRLATGNWGKVWAWTVNI